MIRTRAGLGAGLALAALACTGTSSPLPPGATLGAYTDVDKPESYGPATLYAYMDGGAEVFREYGVTTAWVRRYASGSTALVVERFEMTDARAAAALWSYVRRPGTEIDVLPGCRGSATSSEAQLARGPVYLVCRNEDPLAADGAPVRDLCARLAARLAGPCSDASLFAALPTEGRRAGSETAIVGPLGLNVRPWLAALAPAGLERAWLATYALAGGSAEAAVIEYATADQARQSAEPVRASTRADLSVVVRDRRVALVARGNASAAEGEALAARLLAAAR
jgi:hypothetical protein